MEKPITETLEQAERLVKAKNDTGRVLVPFQSELYPLSRSSSTPLQRVS